MIQFANVLINSREDISEILSHDYSYIHIKEIFKKINSESNPEIKIHPNNKILYRLLTGSYDGSKYDKSSIDWIQSEEFVNAIISVANNFNIKTIEELYTGTGLLSSLILKKEPSMQITAIDTFESIRTCNKLNLIPIAKRSPDDYQYYPLLGEQYPKMVISTYYPDNSYVINQQTKKFMNEMCDLVKNNNHDIIFIVIPRTFTNFSECLHRLSVKYQYNLSTYGIKCLDKFFFIREMFSEYYPNFMTGHILIKNDILGIPMGIPQDRLFVSQYPGINNIKALMAPAIISEELGNYCFDFEKILEEFHEKISPKLVKNIFKNHDILKPLCLDDKLYELKKIYFKFFDNNNINVPQYIYNIDEFIFWAGNVMNGLYFVFENRVQFYAFYTQVISIETSKVRRTINFPLWIQTHTKMKIYIYLEIIKKNSGWKNSKIIFEITFHEINEKNKLLVSKKKNHLDLLL